MSGLERLWAPWRGEYLEGPQPSGECFLCQAWADPDAAARGVLWKGPATFVILNRYPYNNGHLMVAPAAHAGDLEALGPAVRAELMETVNRCVAALREAYRPGGFNIGVNLGACAGAGLPGHLHVHVVPRWAGDTNFMPVTGGAKVISEDPRATWERLRPLFGDGSRS